MLLQTILQLNILILATPALAGWPLLPPAHAGAFHAAGIIWQYRGGETAAPKSVSPTPIGQAKLTSATTPLLVSAQPAIFAADPAAALISFPTLPHAARAP